MSHWSELLRVSWFQCLSWKDSFLSLFIYLSVHSHIFHISLVNLLKHWLCRRFETCSYRQPLCDQHPFLFLPNPPYRINTKINSWRKVISLSLDDCRTLHVFFVKKHLYKQHQTEIWFKIISISGIKRS